MVDVVVVVVVPPHPLQVKGPSTTIVNVRPADVVAEPDCAQKYVAAELNTLLVIVCGLPSQSV